MNLKKVVATTKIAVKRAVARKVAVVPKSAKSANLSRMLFAQHLFLLLLLNLQHHVSFMKHLLKSLANTSCAR